MTTGQAVRSRTIALVGNPNTGKSTLFNALSGARQRTGNFPGVTVEKKTGLLTIEGCHFEMVDLPGTYSLAPRSPDEMVTVDILLGRRDDVALPDVILCIVDATNLQRNLYLLSQLLELGRPTVLALNMVDLARQQGVQIDVPQLQQRLGIPVIEIQANKKRGLQPLREALLQISDQSPPPPANPFPREFQEEVDRLAALSDAPDGRGNPRYLLERLLLDTSGYLEHVCDRDQRLRPELTAARQRLAELGQPVPAVEAVARYTWVGQILDGVVRHPDTPPVTLSDRIDRVLTHRWAGTIAFLLIMILMFQSVFSWAGPAMEWIERLTGWISQGVAQLTPAGPLQSLLVDGVIGGVGSVLVFLPQIFILFLFIGILEDCGYMARAAFLMDRLMSRIGLSGKSFIPLLSSFACAIPGIMATRVIENRRDRLTTMLVAPLMSCSARLPVYTVLIAAFIPPYRYLGGWIGLQGLTMVAMYLLGIVMAIVIAALLKRTLLRGETPPFVMELPSYKWPSLSVVVYRMFERGWAFVRRAGTLILAASIVIWATLYYPRQNEAIAPALVEQRAQLEQQLAAAEQSPEQSASEVAQQLQEVEHAIESAHLRNSYLGQAGQAIEPVVRPLGWDWRIGCAAIASFPAREVVIATLGVIYSLGEELDLEDAEQGHRLRDALRQARWDDGSARAGVPVYNVPVALSIMVFFALCAQCVSTLAVLRRETNSWRWPLFTFVYMTALAYVMALVTYQIGIRLG